jgi:hypothetical protein
MGANNAFSIVEKIANDQMPNLETLWSDLIVTSYKTKKMNCVCS